MSIAARSARSAFRPIVAGAAVIAAALILAPAAAAQNTGSIRGQVTFETTGDPVHGAVIVVVGAGRTATTDADGGFEIRNVPAGTYELVAQREHLSTTRQSVTVQPEQQAEARFALRLQPIHEELTVTATPTGESTTFEAFNSIQSLDSFDIARSTAHSVAELVQRAPGVEIRSFGPGSERPVIRGFDGDRVLILQDGIRTGDLSSQSGDHGTTIDPGALDRIEIVRGPATLLYGSNAVGGVVHALTPQEAFRRTPFEGLRGQFLTDGGSGNGQAAANANVQYGHARWMLWGGGGARRAGDYSTPEGIVENSASRLSSGRVGLGYTGQRASFGVGYGVEEGRYGIPFAGDFHTHGDNDDDDGHDEDEELFIDIAPRRQNVRVDFGLREMQGGFADSLRATVNYLDWQHDELEIEDGIESLGTRFNNDTLSVRAELEQRRAGRLSGRIGLSGEFREYAAAGEEALAPDTAQRAFGVFAYEQLDFGPARLMFGARFDRTSYDTEEREGNDHAHDDDDHDIEPPATRDRAFTGASGSIGLHVDIAPRTALVTTLTRSYRAPALEELYNFGPHFGNLAFEIGNTDLERESSIGLEASLRHRSPRARAEFNVFHYHIDNFVFPSASQRETIDGFFVTEFLQGDSRFTGFDTQGSVSLHEHLWVNLGVGFVRARLAETSEYVPRIPPLHARLSLEVPYRSFTFTPELSWTARQDRLFRNETATDGYAILNLNASYVLARPHVAHIFSLSGHNLTNELYRRHTSFIKDLAPEMGRSVRFSYGIRFF